MLTGNKERGTLRMSGIVGEDFTADAVVDALETFDGDDIRINLQSEGGIITEGLAIYEYFQEYSGEITLRVESIAASIASVLMLGADVIEAGEVATVMVHNPWAIAIGDSGEMRAAAEVLDHLGLQIAETYAARSGQPADYWLELMENETYFSAAQALEEGLIDRVLNRKKQRSAAKREQVHHVPVAKVRPAVAIATLADVKAQNARMRQRMIDTGRPIVQ